MKAGKKWIAIALACSLLTGTCSITYAAEGEKNISETEEIQQATSSQQENNKPEEDADISQDETDVADDPGAGRYQGFFSDGFGDDITPYGLTPKEFTHSDRFDGYTIKKGIDVSEWNGTINWSNVKQDGIEFAIVRGAYRGYGSQGTLVKDKYAANNLKQADAAGIPVGAYIFSQATTEAEAVEEAEYLLDIVKGYNITLPLVMDFEYASDENDENGLTGRLYNADLSASEATAICRAFCRTIEEAGYTAMVYANKDMLENDLNASQISKDYLIWLAHYTSQTNYRGNYNFWQCTSSGKVNGIAGNVDMNYWYIAPDQTKELIKNSNGEWLFYIDGVFQSGFTGLEKVGSTWYYIKNGKWQSNYTGLVEYTSGSLYYVVDGKIQYSYTGLVKLNNTWYYISAGKCIPEYTGLAEYTSGTRYYMSNGIIQYSFTGLIKLDGTWYYIVNGRWQSGYTGLAEYTSGSLYYVKNGTIQQSYTGLIKLDGTWYYIVKGKCQIGYTGLAEYASGSQYYMEKGEICYDFTGLIKISGSWYYIVDGRVRKGYTGLAEYASGSRYYMEKGEIRYDFTGLVKLEGTWYYIVNGKWQSNYTGLAKYSTGSWYYVERGTINYGFTGLVKKDSHMYYVKNGKWQKAFSGTVNINNSRYVISDGMLY